MKEMKQDIKVLQKDVKVLQQDVKRIDETQQKILEREDIIANEIVLIEQKQDKAEFQNKNYGQLISKINSKVFRKTAQ